MMYGRFDFTSKQRKEKDELEGINIKTEYQLILQKKSKLPYRLRCMVEFRFKKIETEERYKGKLCGQCYKFKKPCFFNRFLQRLSQRIKRVKYIKIKGTCQLYKGIKTEVVDDECACVNFNLKP